MGVSIAIATYNRADDLARVLDTLARLDTAGAWPFEVLVIDNNSKDSTPEVVRQFNGLGDRLRYIHEPNQGLSHARNRAIAEARYKVVAFLDDDVDVDPGWLKALESAYASGDYAAVGGSAYLIYPGPRPHWLADRSEGALSKVDLGPDRMEVDGDELYGLNLSIRKDWFERVGLFHAHLGRTGNKLSGVEETELLGRIRAQGGRMLYEPAARVGHIIPSRRLRRSYFWRVAYWMNRSAAEFQPARAITVREVVRMAYHTVRAGLRVLGKALTTGPGSEATFYEIRILCGRWGLTSGLCRRLVRRMLGTDAPASVETPAATVRA